MDRQIVYPGAIPLETDLLNTNKNAMVGLSKLAAAILGTATMLNGFAVTPTGPASLQVYCAPGEIYALTNLDGTAYSSLAADTTHQILKQGISLDQVTLNCPAPATAGQSINYLIEVAYQDSDANAVVLPYYNASNPSQAYSGPANAGTAQNTVRKGIASIVAKAGIAATTGSQTTPAPDAGYVGAYVVTVANGQTQILAGNIVQYSAAQILPALGLIVGGLQGNACNISAASGTADAITGAYTPAISVLANGMTLYVRASSANATTTPTFTPASGTIAAKQIVKGAGSALAAGDIAGGGHWIELQYDLTLDKWVLLNPAKGVTPPQGLYPGTPLMWPVPSCPSWALTRDGSAITRTSYPSLFAALCPTRNGTTTNASNAVTGLSTTTDLYVGMPVEGTGIPAGTTVASITSSTAITLSANATASATVPITLFYYGYGSGGSATTFGVPDDRGLAERGLDTGAKTYDQSAIAGTTTNASAAITGLSSTVGLFVGMSISGAGVPGGATIASITSATAITISSNATASGTVTLTVVGRQIGSYQADSMQGHWHANGYNSAKQYTSGSTVGDFVATAAATNFGNTGVLDPITDGKSGTPRTSPETRGKNRAYLPIIVY